MTELMVQKPKVVVVMPAYGAGITLEVTFRAIPEGLADEVIVVDDASSDNTVEVARRLEVHLVVHPHNQGYGSNQKTCYDTALQRGADIVALLHPDYQYDPRELPHLLEPLLRGEADFVFGSRWAQGGNPLAGGMPLIRYLGNILTTRLENWLLGTSFTELHSGLRAYTRDFLQRIPYHTYSDQFFFDSQIIINAILTGFRVKEVPIATHYGPESSSAGLLPSLEYVLRTLVLALRSSWRRHKPRRQRVANVGPREKDR